MKKLIAFFKEEDGLELTEYAVMGALIVAGTAAVIAALGGAIQGVFTTITGEITP
jgi:pilus assembly protein Flp/PilA